MANGTQPPARVFRDYLDVFDLGINSGDQPLLLPPNQLSFATNVSFRGSYATHRQSFVNRLLTGFDPVAAAGLFQGAAYYQQTTGVEMLMAQISGRLFTFAPQPDNSMLVKEVTIPGDPNDANAPQAWMWQAEKWMITTNGLQTANPIFTDTSTGPPFSRRSNTTPTQQFADTIASTAAPHTVPAIGQTISITFTSGANLVVGDIVTEGNAGQWIVQSGAAPTFVMLNQNIPYVGYTIPNGGKMTWQHNGGNELPPGRMGVYGMGRVWMSLTDGKQFVAGDLVGGSSGTQANNFRDAVLKVTENTFLVGGGYFTVPGSVGAIKAMIFQAILDTQQGQGPLLVVTPKVTFSCQAPVDRTTWANLTNPILTEGMKANGGLGQDSTININSDVFMRSIDGVRSQILAMRDFETWGNTPISFEIVRALQNDTDSLLAYGSAIFFDNRFFLTVNPTASPGHGVYHPGMVVLNCDELSGVRGKAPSIWEGLYLGMNVLKLVVGTFNDVERAFAFVLNTNTNTIEVHEILAEGNAIYDDVATPITLSMESPMLFKDADQRKRVFKQLWNGDISVDSVMGEVTINVQYRPDQYPGWIPWRSWSICVNSPNPNDPSTANFQPGFFPRMGLGRPPTPDTICDSCNNRIGPFGYNFQVRIQITGHCRFLGGRFEAGEQPEPEFGKIICDPPCQPPNPATQSTPGAGP